MVIYHTTIYYNNIFDLSIVFFAILTKKTSVLRILHRVFNKIYKYGEEDVLCVPKTA